MNALVMRKMWRFEGDGCACHDTEVAQAVAALNAFSFHLFREDAVVMLPFYALYNELTDEQVEQVLSHFEVAGGVL